MKDIRDTLAFLLSLLAKIAGPKIQSRLSDLGFWLVPDTPRLSGAWVVRFGDPDSKGRSRQTSIDAKLTQYGRRIQGSGHVQGEPGDPFEYRGWIHRNTFFGGFRRKNHSVLAGTGTFVVKISADGARMKGRCSWYDSDLDEVWSSVYRWNR